LGVGVGVGLGAGLGAGFDTGFDTVAVATTVDVFVGAACAVPAGTRTAEAATGTIRRSRAKARRARRDAGRRGDIGGDPQMRSAEPHARAVARMINR
jgi:hypothetical protein